MSTALKVGDRVNITQYIPWTDRRVVVGEGAVARVTSRCITLTNGSRWRADGYAWGSKSDRFFGRLRVTQIELAQ